MKEFIAAFNDVVDYLAEPFFSYQKISLSFMDLLIFSLALVAANFLSRLAKKIISRRFKNEGAESQGKVFAIIQFTKYAIFVLAILVGLNSIGIDLTLLIAGSTALFVGLGFGLQHTFNDLVSGVILLFEGDLQVTDVVQVDNLVGKVQRIGLRTSQVLTREGYLIIVPNSKFVSNNVINWSHQKTETRFDVSVGVKYGSDVQLVKNQLLECAYSHPDVLSAPSPFVRFLDFGNSSLDFGLYFWTLESFIVENIKSDLRFSIDAAFRANNITIAFPQRDLHFKTIDDPVQDRLTELRGTIETPKQDADQQETAER